jgi:hypothetical protein
MTESLASRQPSDNLGELQGQLLRELAKLQEQPGDEPELYRAYVQHALVLAWRGVADGRMQAPREALDCLRVAQPFIARYMPDMEPAAAAAAEIYALTESLSLAIEALEARRVEDRISDPRSETERAILQVLADNQGTFLRRGEVHERLGGDIRLTPPRVGQILAELHEENVVQKIHGRAQGNPNAAFYALSSQGVELCWSLGLIPDDIDAKLPEPRVGLEDAQERPRDKQEPALEMTSASPPLLDQALSTLVDPAVPPDWRSILAGLIGNLDPNPAIRSRLQYWAGRTPADANTGKLIGTIYSGWNRQDSAAVSPQHSPGSSEMLKALINTAVRTCQTWSSHNQTP